MKILNTKIENNVLPVNVSYRIQTLCIKKVFPNSQTSSGIMNNRYGLCYFYALNL